VFFFYVQLLGRATKKVPLRKLSHYGKTRDEQQGNRLTLQRDVALLCLPARQLGLDGCPKPLPALDTDDAILVVWNSGLARRKNLERY
jgi:hypothetical protein